MILPSTGPCPSRPAHIEGIFRPSIATVLCRCLIQYLQVRRATPRSVHRMTCCGFSVTIDTSTKCFLPRPGPEYSGHTYTTPGKYHICENAKETRRAREDDERRGTRWGSTKQVQSEGRGDESARACKGDGSREDAPCVSLTTPGGSLLGLASLPPSLPSLLASSSDTSRYTVTVTLGMSWYAIRPLETASTRRPSLADHAAPSRHTPVSTTLSSLSLGSEAFDCLLSS